MMTHPDDCELMCAGTLTLLQHQGWEIHIATMTPGDCGSATLNREEISTIRRNEASNAAQILGGTYHCLEEDDIFIMFDKPTILKVISLIREVQPTIVFAPSPSDYMIGHETTSQLVQAACFASGIPNVSTPPYDAFPSVPHLYYADSIDGRDKFGEPILPSIAVDISSVMDTKTEMLCCHVSQREWLQAHHGIDEYVIAMQRFATERGNFIGSQYAEGFRQHLGHAYPQENILMGEIPDHVTDIKKKHK